MLYAHNCTRNYGYHLPQVSWLVPAGWNVVLYDPEETGRSTGKLTLNGMVDDAEAVYQYVRGQRGVSAKKLVLFGQGPGGESLLRLLHRHPDGARFYKRTKTKRTSSPPPPGWRGSHRS